MKITARCHPKLEPILPKPMLAAQSLPDWFRKMPSKVEAETLGGNEVRTLKHCVPFIDAISSGILLPLATDLVVENGELSWDWDPPILNDAAISRSPVGVHVPEQGQGAPYNKEGNLLIKFMNFWTLEVPENWQLLFVHPLNQPDLPFYTISGLVDCHGFKDGYVHFPALLEPGFEGVIKAGTPVAQVIPVPRPTLELDVRSMTADEVDANRTVQQNLQSESGVYRKQYKR